MFDIVYIMYMYVTGSASYCYSFYPSSLCRRLVKCFFFQVKRFNPFQYSNENQWFNCITHYWFTRNNMIIGARVFLGLDVTSGGLWLPLVALSAMTTQPVSLHITTVFHDFLCRGCLYHAIQIVYEHVYSPKKAEWQTENKTEYIQQTSCKKKTIKRLT